MNTRDALCLWRRLLAAKLGEERLADGLLGRVTIHLSAGFGWGQL